MEMLFEHNYARSKRIHRVVYIQYWGGEVVAVITDDKKVDEKYFDGIQNHFDFEPDCQDAKRFMFYHSGGGGSIKSIQAPRFVKAGSACYWMHTDAGFRGKTKNIQRLQEPIAYNGEYNPFNIGREIYSQDYCKFCEKWYDEDLCNDHHIINDEGELEYYDGSKVE